MADAATSASESSESAAQRDADNDVYVPGGTPWENYTLPELISMVTNQASVPHLQRLAEDWRTTGTEIVDASDLLADALDDLMNFWSGESAEQARTAVALNAQWVTDLGETTRQMGDPIEDAAGALKAAQEQMPRLPEPNPAPQTTSAPAGAVDTQTLTGSPFGAAIAGTAVSTDSAFAAQQRQAQLHQAAVETMRRFEAAAMAVDQSTPRFTGPSQTLLPRPEYPQTGGVGSDQWLTTIAMTTGVSMRWQMLTGGDFTGTTSSQGVGGPGSLDKLAGAGTSGFGGGYGGFSGLSSGSFGGGGGRARPGAYAGTGEPPPSSNSATRPAGVSPAGAGSSMGRGGMGMGYMPMGAGLAGMGMGAGGDHRRRFPLDRTDPFQTEQKASPPVIGL